MDNLKYMVNTSCEGGKILQEVLADYGNGVRESLFKQVMDTQEQQIKEALIQLGWTPPIEYMVFKTSTQPHNKP